MTRRPPRSTRTDTLVPYTTLFRSNKSINSGDISSIEGLSSMDDVDRRILRVLQEASDLPVAEIAERVGLSPSPCWRRIQKLEAEGAVERPAALLNTATMNVGRSDARRAGNECVGTSGTWGWRRTSQKN